MKQKIVGMAVGLLFCVAAGSTSFGIVVDLTTRGSAGTINGAVFQQTDPQPTGTGYIDSFVRIRQTGNEAAYNTSGTLPNPFNQLGGSAFNRDVMLSTVPIIDGKYQFLLDINESGNDPQPLLSLNQIEVFLTSVPGQTGGSWNNADGRLITTGMTDLHLAYDMNLDGSTANRIELDYDLNPGSGAGDMFMYLPTTMFVGVPGQYLLLYSQFGDPPGPNNSNDGFEEWSIIAGQVIPEPGTTTIAGAFLLLLFGRRMLRNARKRAAA